MFGIKLRSSLSSKLGRSTSGLFTVAAVLGMFANGCVVKSNNNDDDDDDDDSEMASTSGNASNSATATSTNSNSVTGSNSASTSSNASNSTSDTASNTDTGTGTNNIVDIALGNPEFSTLVKALKAADLVDTLKGTGPFTVFAPTNAAFDALPQGTLDELLKPENKEKLKGILLHHVIAAKVLSTGLVDKSHADTQSGYPVFVDLSDGTKISGAKVTTADVSASNGVIHIVDSVILPPEKNIVELAQATPNLSKLVQAVTAAELATTLSGDGPFTVFAPTDAAFEALGSGVFDDLVNNKKTELADILKYHVVGGTEAVYSSDIMNNQMVDSLLAGKKLTFTIDPSTGAKVQTVQISAVDVLATNGVVHVIDAVLTIPEAP